ncbi:MAG: TetR/AcrR family transcriptional regulator [Desulfobacteraceae bacterium]|nr:TetR/AcrR family transcriptional regulator [Desulfobacteraceae bacterium]MDH3574969.1 TetR/AcrR family transcriptional regulator [Desulfobacteraceae bacterium]MDH3722315.1 TetR/AcrR family transcriptional regulator [Desulfobacteraceae bacterium]MDH3838033.1 TetR/AcrR family transcriptional regulator [Desulfobacteraceae bacterium]MDH3873038.1 TetR/AcrR family transcriptional regulator [Desulfobacteraceae bacterium]
MSGLREAKKKKTRQAIMNAAIKLFSEKGFKNTSVDELAKMAGVGKSTIYGYFHTKNEIFLAFCEDQVDFAFSDLAKKRDPEAPLKEQLLTLFMGQFRYVTKNYDFGRILSREMVFPKELTIDKSNDLSERYLSALGEILTRAISRNELRDDLELLFISGHFYALYIMVLSAWYERRFQSEQEIEQALEKLLTQAMEGLSPKNREQNIA